MSENREFNLILAGSCLFYAFGVLLVFHLPLPAKRPAPAYSSPRKITMVVPPLPPKPKPLPPRVENKTPVPVLPKKTVKPSPPPSPPAQKTEDLQKKREERAARQKAEEAEKNRKLVQDQFASLFGNTTEEVTQSKGLDVISANKSGAPQVQKGTPAGVPSNELQVKTEGIDRILKNLPASSDKKGAVLGEHQTTLLSGSGGSGPDGNGPGRSARTPEDIERLFKAYEGRLRSYYEKVLQTHPAFSGIMVIRMTIAPDGHVVRCDVLSSELKDKPFETEITRIIQEQFKFTKIIQGEEFYDRKLNFHPIK
ncbi:MAG: AgmX/PglI C-terminal domain-containing protein [Nitrospirae bacterium]|nr:AgmX/PglI C-terminal domain-containing protein [Nitrospirota bacterium]